MKIKVNNKEIEAASCINISQLITQLELPNQSIAVAVNNQMITRDKWDHSSLQENDKVVIIKAACGG